MNNLIIIEKYEEFVNYIYPAVQSVDRKHGYVKQKFMDTIFQQVDIFYKAIKSNQKSRLYEADGNLATIRFYLRFFANIYGHIFDRFIKTKLKIKQYFRYMDDTVILSNDKLKLIYIQKVLKRFSSMFMKLKFSKWFINSVESKGLNFLGYRIREKYKLIRKDSVVRAKRKIKKYKRDQNDLQLQKFLGSWTGHIKNCDSANLKFYIKKEYNLWNNKQLA